MDGHRVDFFTSKKSMAEIYDCILPVPGDWHDVFSQASLPGFPGFNGIKF